MKILCVVLLGVLTYTNTVNAQSPDCLLSLNVDAGRGIEISSGPAPYSSTCGIIEAQRQEIYRKIQELQGKSYSELKGDIQDLRKKIDDLSGQKNYKAIRAVGSKVIAYGSLALCGGAPVSCGVALAGYVWSNMDMIDAAMDIQSINSAIDSLQSKLSEAEKNLDSSQMETVDAEEFLLKNFENLCREVQKQCL